MFILNEYKLTLLILLVIVTKSIENEYCDRRPLGTKAAPLPPDDRFQLTVDGIIDQRYIPAHSYTVSLFSSDGRSTFIAFTISAQGDTMENPRNIRKPIPLKAGTLHPSPDNDDSKVSQVCRDTVLQSTVIPKTSVKIVWKAPPKGNGCVTISALVAVKNDVWYNKEGPLIKRICEDQRQKEDMQPPMNINCKVCEEARYMLTLEGSWTYNTHGSRMFPEKQDLAHFSDLIGASHNNRYELWKFNKEASPGLRMLAEQGNTTRLEMEIQQEYLKNPVGIRTIIKAKGQADPSTPTFAIFRVNRDYHRISLVTAILPSPDWFLGVADLELCDVDNNKWATNILLNLYPLDAGTDSGKYFESPNDESLPAQPISRAIFKSERSGPITKFKPFARLKVDLVRTYELCACNDEENTQTEETTTVTEQTTRTTESAITLYPIVTEKDEKCPLSEWEEWPSCTGDCENGKINGFQTRERYHLVDGVPVDKYIEDEDNNNNIRKYQMKNVPEECRNKYLTSETRECEEDCEVDDVTTTESSSDQSFLGRWFGKR